MQSNVRRAVTSEMARIHRQAPGVIDVLHQRWMPAITLSRCATLLLLQLAQVPLEGTRRANANRPVRALIGSR